MISKDEVKHIAKLARLELTEVETEKMQKDLSAILDYFHLLEKANAPIRADINADSRGNEKRKNNGLRQDMVVENPASLANNLVEQAPDKKEVYVKVKNIF